MDDDARAVMARLRNIDPEIARRLVAEARDDLQPLGQLVRVYMDRVKISMLRSLQLRGKARDDQEEKARIAAAAAVAQAFVLGLHRGALFIVKDKGDGDGG